MIRHKIDKQLLAVKYLVLSIGCFCIEPMDSHADSLESFKSLISYGTNIVDLQFKLTYLSTTKATPDTYYRIARSGDNFYRIKTSHPDDLESVFNGDASQNVWIQGNYGSITYKVGGKEMVIDLFDTSQSGQYVTNNAPNWGERAKETMADILHLGIPHLELDSIRWTGNKFLSTNTTFAGAYWEIEGEIIPNENTVAPPKGVRLKMKVELPKTQTTAVHDWRLDYKYFEGSNIDFLPKEITVNYLATDGSERPIFRYEIEKWELSENVLPVEYFSHTQFINTNHPFVLHHTNNVVVYNEGGVWKKQSNDPIIIPGEDKRGWVWLLIAFTILPFSMLVIYKLKFAGSP